MHFVGVLRLLCDGAAQPDDVRAQRFYLLGKFTADISHAEYQNGGTMNGFHFALTLPDMQLLRVAVSMKAFDNFQKHGKHMFGNRKDVRSR